MNAEKIAVTLADLRFFIAASTVALACESVIPNVHRVRDTYEHYSPDSPNGIRCLHTYSRTGQALVPS